MRDRRPFWDKVTRLSEGECWPWTGYVNPAGRPMTQHRYTLMLAGRKAWILTHGEIRDGLCVNHRCDNALCCNPAHLYLGSRADNMIDRWGRVPAGERQPYGRKHVMTEEQVNAVVKQHAKGTSIVELARKLGVHRRTIERRLRERGRLSPAAKD